MSSIGKIFIIVNLVLALVVLGAAGAMLKKTDVTNRQYEEVKTQLDAAKADLDQARSDFVARESSLNSDKTKLAQEKESADVERQTAENKVAKLEADNQKLRSDVGAINASLQALDASMSSSQQRVIELTDANSQARDEMMTAKAAANEAEKARTAAESAMGDRDRQITELQGQLDTTAAELATANKLLEVAKASGVDVTNVMAMPRIEANVAEVDEQYGFVVLDKGRKDNVERGFVFEVHRDGTYLGKVKVDEIYDNYSTARIELKAPNTTMQRHDKASTYLN